MKKTLIILLFLTHLSNLFSQVIRSRTLTEEEIAYRDCVDILACDHSSLNYFSDNQKLEPEQERILKYLRFESYIENVISQTIRIYRKSYPKLTQSFWNDVRNGIYLKERRWQFATHFSPTYITNNEETMKEIERTGKFPSKYRRSFKEKFYNIGKKIGRDVSIQVSLMAEAKSRNKPLFTRKQINGLWKVKNSSKTININHFRVEYSDDRRQYFYNLTTEKINYYPFIDTEERSKLGRFLIVHANKKSNEAGSKSKDGKRFSRFVFVHSLEIVNYWETSTQRNMKLKKNNGETFDLYIKK